MSTMRQRDQPAPRQRRHGSRSPAVVELEGDVEHGESRADEKDGTIGRDRVERAGPPRIADIQPAVKEGAIGDGNVRRRIVAERENDPVGEETAPALEGDVTLTADRFDVHHLTGDLFQLRRAPRCSRLLEDVREVVPVDPPGHEGASSDLRHVGAGKTKKAVLVVRERAHPASRDVEHVT